MGTARWLGACRWVHVLLVFVYVFVTIMVVIVWLVLLGLRMPDWLRWVMLVGWFAVCFGGVLVLERMGFLIGQGCRRPIKSEEERLFGLIDEVYERMGSNEKTGKEVRFFVRSTATAGDGSFGCRTIIISSSTLLLASDEELRGILAHEWGHLRDGDPILEAAFFSAGIFARGFRVARGVIRRGFRLTIVGGLVLLALSSPVILPLLFFFLLDSLFRGLIWGLRKIGDLRQDCYAVRAGCGKGLRDWLEKSGLAANINRIRRLEKML
ncbi:MAG TPA: M48 family metalloprotease [Puia sp.]|nr:M48 family metalloprotease [Puia sp.]